MGTRIPQQAKPALVSVLMELTAVCGGAEGNPAVTQRMMRCRLSAVLGREDTNARDVFNRSTRSSLKGVGWSREEVSFGRGNSKC